MNIHTRKALSRGFTLVELVIAIAVIAILAALLVPTILGQVERSRRATAMASAAELAKTMKRFKDETGYWPYGASIWNPGLNGSSDVSPAEFTSNDTAMFLSVPPDTSLADSASPLPPLKKCAEVHPGNTCYNGPYLSTGSSMADPMMRDPWGSPFRYVYNRPCDGVGACSAPEFPQGFVAIWSAGPDRLDATGCVDSTQGGATAAPGCTLDRLRIAQGQPSVPGADDIVRFVGQAL
jgi:prepilin-type N-terminal cleavage/methylation domain-containing protein